MKRVLFIAALCLLSVGYINAQTDKKQVNYLPEAGEWALGIDVTPVLKYIGNAFNGSTDNELNSLGGTPFSKGVIDRPEVSIMGKYMLTDQWALRANVGISIFSGNDKEYVTDDNATSSNRYSENKVIDKRHVNNNGLSLALGAEYRKGSRRVQGVFGFGMLFAFQNQNIKYTWGNEMTSANQQPTSSFGQYGGTRILEDYSTSSDFYTGLTGSAGIEWFIWPKISLGAEVNLSAYYAFGSKTYRKSESYNSSSRVVEERTDMLSPRDNAFYLGTESLGGSLNMTFYF